MKKLILASTLALMSASSFAADDHSGFRVGGGFGTDIGKYQLRDDALGGKIEADPSVVLEAGYDFNGIFAINVKGSATGLKSYENKKDKGAGLGTAYDLAVEAEAGYTFVTPGDASIKPYIALGAVGFDKDTSASMLDGDKGSVRARGAAGVRMTLDNGVYFDGRIQATDVTAKGDKFNGKDDLLTQGMVTVGYKF
ncbi:hypothetical protein VIN01S_02290 [Vibrio inusitatus NBRC 102082]|uniref:Outer membrane protein beta-barrel domain-containing protein n=1 Tax=Vibrio inusitatus NBRC 102082 TaxID=1219070 RepID=A0A4Y3HQV7_9VIBR|nr:porin family protein [Vibrio inusitatus]GEA49425.1 hypothetical protein VIN01S_02290 [Vibrio inusitatus NBRC 102082]